MNKSVSPLEYRNSIHINALSRNSIHIKQQPMNAKVILQPLGCEAGDFTDPMLLAKPGLRVPHSLLKIYAM